MSQVKYKMKPQHIQEITAEQLVDRFVELNSSWWDSQTNALEGYREKARSFCLELLKNSDTPDYSDHGLMSIEKYFNEYLAMYEEVQS